MTQPPYDPFAAPPPGGPSPYPQQQAASDPWRPNMGLSTALTVLFSLMALALVVNTIGLLRRSIVMSDTTDLASISISELDSLDLLVGAPALLYVLLMLVTIPTFIVWQFRHAKNARILGQSDGLGPGWAIGGWFIPVANAVLPALQLRGADRWSYPAAARPGKPSPLIVPWLACFVVGNTVVQIATMGEPEESEGVNAYREWIVTSDLIEAGGTVLLIAAVILAVLMVRTVTTQQEAQQPAAQEPWAQGQPTAYPWGPPPPNQGQQWPAPPHQGQQWPQPPYQAPPPPPHP